MIGVFDSGLGGLSVLRSVRDMLPGQDLLYLADSAYCPYGPRPLVEVQGRALAIGRWLVAQGAAVVVIACNTATSAAADLLRAELPVPVVGMEPGLKPAIAASRSGRVAVLATSGTLGGERFASLVDRFAGGAQVLTVACPDLVGYVEAGDLDGPEVRAAVVGYLAPLLAEGVDSLVLGCTHFPFLRPLIAELVGPAAAIIDTGPAVAAQVARVAAGSARGVGALRCVTTGDPAEVAVSLARVWGGPLPLSWASVEI
ncbi:glutamate racemase [Oscillochloris sp. ZM17-4]|uniref:glutamate racemase n=1 Tax=Oscillochloris sp. ZM17-4 TaxID=2866714 RepID=UPI001C73AAE7|nr:glutamate racemase [Oscillochloris sp. ZM17-4]MBX0328948.1 glutamate racemase [Oscillochloris sp. ZM17-4]